MLVGKWGWKERVEVWFVGVEGGRGVGEWRRRWKEEKEGSDGGEKRLTDYYQDSTPSQ